MPTYEYECSKCAHRFEKFQKMTDKPAKTCPSCGGPVRRLLGTGAAVIMKGAAPPTAARGAPQCGREAPCCGRDTPCQIRPCDR